MGSRAIATLRMLISQADKHGPRLLTERTALMGPASPGGLGGKQR